MPFSLVARPVRKFFSNGIKERSSLTGFTSECWCGTTNVYDGDAKDERIQKSILEKFGLPWKNLVTCEQVHGNNVTVVSNFRTKIFPKTDGLVTALSPIVLGVFSADCLPIFLIAPKKRIIGILHSGWRGTTDKIVQKGIALIREKWDVDMDCLKVLLGPHIRQCCYEVNAEVADLFPEKCKTKSRNKIYLALEKAVALQLQESGVPLKNITSNPLCTCCDKRFFSYRRDRTQKRMLSFIAQGEKNEKN